MLTLSWHFFYLGSDWSSDTVHSIHQKKMTDAHKILKDLVL